MENQAQDPATVSNDQPDSPAMYQSLNTQPAQNPDPEDADPADSLLHPRPARAMFFPADDWDF